MSAYPAWTPAPRPGIIPLHPVGFGTIMGRSFAALRHNPRVLFGFALSVQALMYVLTIVVVGFTTFASLSRLDTVAWGSEDYETIMIGSGWTVGIVGVVMTLLSLSVQVLVQAVVIVEVTHAAVAEKLTVRMIWQRVRPVAWRLIGYSLLVLAAITVAVVVVGAAVFGAGVLAGGLAIALAVLAVLAAIPLFVWLNTKLILVPSVIVIENARIFDAMRRSWRLTRTRFWPTFGVIVLISVIFSFVGQAVSVPFSILGSGVTTIFNPTADTTGSLVTGIVFLCLSFVLSLIVQSVSLIVTSTASALIYVDCRMRHEGLDIDLLAYVEKRDAGEQNLVDPWTQHIGREIAPRPEWTPGMPPPYGQPYPAGAYGAPAQDPYAQAGYPPPFGYPGPAGMQGGAAGRQYPAPPRYPAPPQYTPPAAPAPGAAPAPPASSDPAAPSATQWAAPGADEDRPWQ